ncbi:GLE1-like protein [Quillaja saponaria]|uniref:mRNA export factor GLE1 n=1 Tax=Quillaja saponaria TaxID=32244 RepID=A0AAD7KTE1_QUISA|nr:GLE1-like protein [Quillaja saponaria]
MKLDKPPLLSKSIPCGNSNVRRTRSFVMHAPEFKTESSESEDEEENYQLDGKRYNFDEIYLSDDSDNESALDVQPYLMDEVGLEEDAFYELKHEYQLAVKEEIRNQISALEAKLMSENEKSTSALARIEKYKQARREMDKKLDAQYQRRIAEALDNHLTAIQRDRELRSQIEERKIRSDAAYEEARRKEKAMQEEKIRQEKAMQEEKLQQQKVMQEEKLRQEKAKADAKVKLKAEEAEGAAIEIERRVATEAVEREATVTSRSVASGKTQVEAVGPQTDATSRTLRAESLESRSNGTNKSHSEVGDVYRASANALDVEHRRLQKLKEIYERDQQLRFNSNKDYTSYERNISRFIRQISGTKDNVRSKAIGLINILNDPHCPRSISIGTFAKKVASHCASPHTAFACGYVIVLVASQVPDVMDLLLAEFHRACIYTVPKHIVYSESAFKSKEDYYKSIGYREDDGKIESSEDYLKRLKSYMKLYGSLVQTEISGIQNVHGLKEGWTWLARFLNALPANRYTAVALSEFLQMAGFALFRRYKSQFRKILNIISQNFLVALKAREESGFQDVIVELQSYIEDKKFLQEPEGRSLQSSLLSRERIVN